MEIAFAILIGFFLDMIFGEPKFLIHPVVIMGKFISILEKLLRKAFQKTALGEKLAGVILAFLLPTGSLLVSALILYFCNKINPYFRLAIESFMCFQIFAAKSLKQESMAVLDALKTGDITCARNAVGRIVGRDTQRLDEAGIARAAVETVAENTADGVIAPLIFMAIWGAPLGFFYKAINTMDSMVGYKNDKYLNFGMPAAKLDDFANFIPARFAGLAMIVASFLVGLDYKNAWKIFRRDRFNHASPNSAQTESVMAGALGLQLAGDAFYFGKVVHKKTIGDSINNIEPKDIAQANKLMYATAVLCLLICCGARILIF